MEKNNNIKWERNEIKMTKMRKRKGGMILDGEKNTEE